MKKLIVVTGRIILLPVFFLMYIFYLITSGDTDKDLDLLSWITGK